MKKLLASLAVSLLLVLGLVADARAQGVNDFVINDFYGRYELINDTPGGRLLVQETLDVNFRGQNRGILRALPKKNRDIALYMKIMQVQRDGKSEKFTTYDDGNGNRVVRIGDEDIYLTGQHSYVINYELSRGVVNDFTTYDEWYWDINGTGWQQPFMRVRGEVIAADGIFNDPGQAACYTGSEGENETDCTITKTPTGYTFAASRPLRAGETLTVATSLNPVFESYTTRHWIRDNILQLVGVGFGLASFASALYLWLTRGRDLGLRGTIVAEYAPPKGYTPTEVGLIADFNVQGRDITAALVDLAVRKYLVIHDDTKKLFGLFTTHNFALELKNPDYSKLKPHESALMEAIFSTGAAGEIVQIKDLNRSTMSTVMQKLRKDLQKSLTKTESVFEPAGKRWSGIFVVVGMVCFAVGIFLPIGLGWKVGFFIAAASYLGFSAAMQRRTHIGSTAYEQIKGLELYMKTAEADRLAMTQSVDSPYNPPEKTYKLFERLLPYAVALGVEKSWAKQFDGLFDKAPDWYQGNNIHAFNAGYFASSLSSGLGSMSQSFSAQTGSTSSGSGGGGSSGGGGGGGGGGGW